MNTDEFDITGKVGPLYPQPTAPEWPLYSFNRIAAVFLQGAAEALNKRRWSEADICALLQSKQLRWSLDGELTDQLKALGAQWAKEQRKVKA